VKQSSGRDFFVLLALCLIGVVFGRLQSTATADGKTDLVSRGVRATVEPLSRVFTSAANGTSDFFGGIFSAAELSRRNRELMQLQTIASQYADTMGRLERDIDNLRKLNDMPPVAGRTKIAATVIGYAPNENRITISVGLDKGITVGLAVVTAQGLVGTVQTVDKGSSQVSLLSDPNRKIGAMVSSRNPPPIGVIRGENANTLVLPLESSSPVQNGDLVSTSGFSDRIPRGIPIGRVNQIYDDPNSGSRRVEVFPNVALGSVREVIVLK
jgi:rod shape-determining protein MreC